MEKGNGGPDLSNLEGQVPVGYPCRNAQQTVEKGFVPSKQDKTADMGLGIIALMAVEAMDIHEINHVCMMEKKGKD